MADLETGDRDTIAAYLASSPPVNYSPEVEKWLKPIARELGVKTFRESGLPQDVPVRGPFEWINHRKLRPAVSAAFLEWATGMDGGRPRGETPTMLQRLSEKWFGSDLKPVQRPPSTRPGQTLPRRSSNPYTETLFPPKPWEN